MRLASEHNRSLCFLKLSSTPQLIYVCLYCYIQLPGNCYPVTKASCPLVCGSLLPPAWTRSSSSRRVTIRPSAMWAHELKHQAAPCAWVSTHTHIHTHTGLHVHSLPTLWKQCGHLTPSFPPSLLPSLTPPYPNPTLPIGNQARVADKSTVVSTSTRNFPNRLGKGANVFLASAELASIAAIEGKLPSVDEYQKYASKINETSADTFRYLNFDRLSEYVEKGKSADLGPEVPYRSVLRFL